MPKAKPKKAKQKPIEKPLMCAICAMAIGKDDEKERLTKTKWAHESCVAVVEQVERITTGAKQFDLTQKQFHFALLYATHPDFFGNGTRSYIEAYGLNYMSVTDQAVAATCSWRLLRNVKIIKCVAALTKIDTNVDFVDTELGFVCAQRENMPAKVSGMALYYKRQGLIVDRSKVVTMTHEEMVAELRQLQQGVEK